MKSEDFQEKKQRCHFFLLVVVFFLVACEITKTSQRMFGITKVAPSLKLTVI